MENIALEHERDLTNSANERAIFGESFVCVDYMLLEMTKILSGLVFYPDNIKKNLELTKGLIMSERLMIALTERGMGRQEAHELVRTMAQEAFSKGRHLKDLVLERKVLPKEDAEQGVRLFHIYRRRGTDCRGRGQGLTRWSSSNQESLHFRGDHFERAEWRGRTLIRHTSPKIQSPFAELVGFENPPFTPSARQ